MPTISSEPETLADSTNEFARLNYLYNGNSTGSDTGLIANPLYFIKSGYIGSSTGMPGGIGDEGIYRSSTNYDAQKSYSLSHYGNLVRSEWSGNKAAGYSIRCLAR